MKYAVIVWRVDSEILTSNGDVYGWYESIGTAVNTAVDLMRQGAFAKAVAVKLI